MSSTLPPPSSEGALLLPDGRYLGYAEYGPGDGPAILWFHGTPGARRQISPAARRLAVQRGVRLIAIERPGIGESTAYAYPSFADWADDIRDFCDARGIDRFAVCGLSGGGPYALACAYYLDDRVVAATILGGVAPSRGEEAAKGGVSPLVQLLAPVFKRTRRPLNRLLATGVRRAQRYGHTAIDVFARFMPPGDKLVFDDPAMREMFIDDLVYGGSRQMQAALLDVLLFARDWGFRLADVQVPVYLLYGDADNIVPLRHGEHLAERLPNAEFRVRPGEGHLGGLGAAEEIFGDLLAHLPRRSRATTRSTANAGPSKPKVKVKPKVKEKPKVKAKLKVKAKAKPGAKATRTAAAASGRKTKTKPPARGAR